VPQPGGSPIRSLCRPDGIAGVIGHLPRRPTGARESISSSRAAGSSRSICGLPRVVVERATTSAGFRAIATRHDKRDLTFRGTIVEPKSPSP
jgi:hypothetical protein